MILGFLFFIRTFLKHCKALCTETYRRYINIVLYYFVYSTLPFDREASAHAYYTTGL